MRYDVICNDMIFQKMVDNFKTAGFGDDVIDLFDPFAVVKQNFAMSCEGNYFQDFTPCNFIYRYLS